MQKTTVKKWLPYIIMTVLFSTMGLIGWFGIVPFHKYIIEKANDIQKFHTSRENRQRQINKLPELDDQFKLIKENEKSLDILLTEDHIVDFVKTLEGLAADTHTRIVIQSQDKGEIQDKKTAKAVRKPNANNANSDSDEAGEGKSKATILESIPYDRYLRISVSVQGEYADIVNFLHKMENLPYGLDVIGVQMKLKPEDEDAPKADNKNPFSLVSGGSVLSSQTNKETQTTEKEKPQEPKGRVLATFDTVVYVNKP